MNCICLHQDLTEDLIDCYVFEPNGICWVFYQTCEVHKVPAIEPVVPPTFEQEYRANKTKAATVDAVAV